MAKLIFFDFRCTVCEHKFADLVKSSVHSIPCPNCSEESKRLISTPRLDPRMGLDPEGNPSMGDKWAKIRKQRAQIEKKHYQEHGTNMSPGADVAG